MQHMQKKPGHFAKICRSQLPPLPKNRGQYPQRQNQQTRNVKNISVEKEQTIAPPLDEEEEEESIDPEPTMYITEFMEDWKKINLIEREFKETKNFELKNMTPNGEIIIQTTPNKNNKLNWLTDTGSPRSFIDINTANELIQNNKNMILQSYVGQMKFKCFNNQDIPIIGQIQMEIQSGSWTAKNCNIFVVKHRSQNLMGRYVLSKLGLTLAQQQTEGKKFFNINENIIE